MNEVEHHRRKLERMMCRFFHITGIPIGFFHRHASVYPEQEYDGVLTYHHPCIQTVYPDYIRPAGSGTIFRDSGGGSYFLTAADSLIENGCFIAGPFFFESAHETELPEQLAQWESPGSLRNLHTLYDIRRLLQQLIEEHFYIPEEEEIEQLRIEYRKEGMTHHPYEQEKVFLEALKDGNPAAFEWLENIESQSSVPLGSPHPVRDFKNKLIMACAILSRTAMEKGTDPDEAMTMSDYFLREVERKQTTEALSGVEKQIYVTFFHMMQQKEASHYSAFVWKIRELVKNNITGGVDLAFISEFVNRTPGYVSTVFKKECGLTLKQFILQEKIKEAKKYLLHTEDPILDIAVQFQFKDQTYFTKVFKKHTGQTPHQFRQYGPQI
ncbi:helix-turn-helix domain-containing protein [Salibacterium sp. K-3]